MTYLEKIKEIIDSNCDMDNVRSIDKLVTIAFYYGKEKATKEISDKYNSLIQVLRERAKNTRYHKLANSIIGDKNYIYSPDYAMEFTTLFGSDEW